jgi:hypothetical protein
MQVSGLAKSFNLSGKTALNFHQVRQLDYLLNNSAARFFSILSSGPPAASSR